MAAATNTSVDQIFDALRVLGTASEPTRVADLARELHLPTSTAHRLLVTLRDAGFAERDSTGSRYELGIRAFELVQLLFREYGVAQASEPFLRRLVEVTGETAALDLRVGWYAVRMAGLEGTREVHAAPRIGQTCRLGDSAGGRAILAALPDAALEAYQRWARPARAERRELSESVGAARDAALVHRVADDGGAAELALAVRLDDRSVAAVVIEGAGSSLTPTPRASELKRCRRIVADLEALVDADPTLAGDPFAHVDPSAIELTHAHPAR